MKIHFNTGRMYEEDGQHIYVHIEDDLIFFVDRSRNIDGVMYVTDREVVSNGHDLALYVMDLYDDGLYHDAASADAHRALMNLRADSKDDANFTEVAYR